MESKDEINRLFQKFVDKTISAEELKMLNSYILQSKHDSQIRRLLTELWDYIGLTEKYQPGALPKEGIEEMKRMSRLMETLMKAGAQERQAIEEKIEKINKEYQAEEKATASKKPGFWGWLKRFFAVGLVLTAAGIWYYVSHQQTSTGTEIAYVEKTSEFGQKSTIPLPDGSLVKLNSGSKLVYPKLFEGNTREVSLEGEAFFEVARDEHKPFIVRSGDLVTTVLGTSFNIKAYPDEEAVSVAVATGKVKVEKAGKEGVTAPHNPESPEPDAHLLTANMLASYNPTDSEIKVESRENIEDLIAWREGVLKFSGLPFSEVAKTLEKWYGVKVVLENQEVSGCVIFGEFKNESLKRVMQTLRYAIDIEYELTTDGLFVGGKGCHAPI